MTSIQAIAKQRIERLYQVAREAYPANPELSRRYIELLQKIVKRNRTKMPVHIKRNICSNCNTVQIEGLNSHTRIRQHREPHIAKTCHVCGHITRIPIKEKKT